MIRIIHIIFVTILCVLTIGCTQRGTPAPVASLSTTPTTLKQKIKIRSSSYIVKKGETLYSISFRANKDFRDLAKINGISKPYKIYPGQKLKLNSLLASKKNTTKQAKKTALTTSYKQKSNKLSKKDLVQPKKPEYVQKQANKLSKTKKTQYAKNVAWQWPAKGKVIRRFSNKDNGFKGILIANKRSTAIHAASHGTVVYAGSALKGYGQLIIVKHNDDYLSAYAHNRRLLVKEKQEVKAGQLIAEMGSSDAKMTGLRFEIRYRGKSVNPVKYLP
ncbi:peptidoglycan DD-metalloendopeptidase family protein [Pseudoalteromonas sp. C2R02]|uniref:peptidoglycan DD-metalloendopeptidase family protein n=1 Tax=Pseudoalteromonas sp. C2R02 TaxID=2841565 RepID=UPI001C0A4E6C|nr:peptidoglycan DD-metalloendopeptidase family protein [Pseudoalteromonas sp. C2R02]MBU2971514.1 peptidoglycan DD-metalloendopeptidase family protein [Pseudoalteromonas sp. C2R02]